MTEASTILDHLFRHQAGRITARLARLLGPAQLDAAEEAVQDAMLRAVKAWPERGIPDNPAAWLFQVAHNAAMDAVRHRRLVRDREDFVLAELSRSSRDDLADPTVEEQLRDDELRMILMCCHPEIPSDARVALSLKIAGGFSIREIAAGMLASDETVAQRIVRAKRRIREKELTLDLPPASQLPARMDSLLEALYLMFNEGYSTHEGEALVREDLCMEALRLGRLTASSSLANPRADALVALMALHGARLSARTDGSGDLVLLEKQDRSLWNQGLIALGFTHFDRSMRGDEVSRYHVEAAIAATHARGEPREWGVLLQLYDQLLEMNPSPVVELNRAVVIAKLRSPEEGLKLLEGLRGLEEYPLWLAAQGHLLLELGRSHAAAECFQSALRLRCSEPERRFLQSKLDQCGRDAVG